MKKIFFAVLLSVTFIFGGCDTQAASKDRFVDSRGNLKISMLNVGHGDAILIQTRQQTILIDTGNINNQAQFVSELEKLSVTKIDKIILTHAHGDHIGGAKLLINPSKKVLETYPYLEKISVAAIYDNGVVHTSGIYKNYIKATAAKNLPYQHLKAGDKLDFGDGVKFHVLSPASEFVNLVNSGQYDKEDRQYDLNNGSIVGKLTYKKFSMMFTGDCENPSEAKILSANKAEDLNCTVLKAGHHGYGGSSSEEFVAAVNPKYILISSLEKGDPKKAYGAPYLKPLETYLAQGVDVKNILCTRWNGTISLISDGKNVSVEVEKKEDWVYKWMEKKRKYKMK